MKFVNSKLKTPFLLILAILSLSSTKSFLLSSTEKGNSNNVKIISFHLIPI